ncbi:MAG: Cys-Gln thioester bond-forming surface protein [Ruminococcus sp.]|nr:Cys-Gln thioester bond-forming surface protein [Ruminococcus sp.]
MKFKKFIKRIASAAMALAICATTITASFNGAITATAAEDKFSIRVSKDNYGFWHYTGFPDLENGISAFCYNYGKHAWSGDTYTESDVSYSDVTKRYLGYVQYYGYPNADTSDAYFGATQCLIWEILGGYRSLDNSFALKGAGYKGLISSQVQKKAYDDIVKRVQNHHTTMSCDGDTFTLKFNPAKKRYETVITDNNALGGAFNFVTKLRSEGFTVEQNDSKHYTVATTAPITSAKSVSFSKNIPFRYKQTSVTYVCAGTISGRPTQDNQIMGLQNYIDPADMGITLATEKSGSLSFDKRFLNTDGSVTDEYYVKQNGLYSKVAFTLKENTTGENVYLKGSNGSYSFVALNHTAGIDYTGSTATIKVNSDTGKCSVTGLPVGNYTLVEKLDTTGDVNFLLSNDIAVSIKSGQTTAKIVDNKSEKGYYGVRLAKHWVDEFGNDYSSANKEDYKKLLDLFKEDTDTDYSKAFYKVNDLFNTVKFIPYVVVDGTKYYLNSTGGKQLYSTDFEGWIIKNALGQDDSVMMSANMAGICPHKEDAIELSFDDFGHGSYADVNFETGAVNELPSIYVFGLTKNTSVLPIDTDHWHYAKGPIGVNGTTDGKIYFEEISADKTYAAVPQNVDSVDATAVDFTRSDVVDVYNYKRTFNVKVVKTDKETGVAVAGAKYGIFNKETDEKIAEGVTDANGVINFTTGLAVDKKYYVLELEAPADYMIDTVKHDVEFTGNLDTLTLNQRVAGTSTLALSEQAKKGYLKIEKKDDLGNIVANVKFDVTTMQDITLNDKAYAAGAVIATLTTDKNGKAEIKDIPLGTYKVKETGKYNPYTVSDEEQTVTFEGSEVAATVQYVSKTLEYTNFIQRGKLTIVKVADFDKTKTLAGAEFQITVAKDFVVNGHKILSKGDVIATLTTDENGKATNYKEVDVTVEEIPMYVGAEYTVTEIKAPEGYTLDNTPKSFTMKWDDTPELRYVSETQVFGNAENSGSIQVSKRTEGNFNVANIKFALSGTSTQGQTVSQAATTDENGVALFTTVPTGTYAITEDGATVPTAYLVADKQEVTVVNAQTTNVEFYNEEKEGSVTVQKHTKGDLNISGITFNLKGQSESGRDISVSATTDENGVAKFTNVPIGVYEITENGQTVPTAYMVAGKKNVKVEYAQTANVQFTNEEKTGAIELQKRTEGNLNISGINFVLKGTADTGEYVEITATTDENGVAKFDKIPVGSAYEIVEDGDSVPTAYLVAESKKDVKVEYAKTTNVEIVNEERTGSIALQKKTKDMTNIKGIRFVLSGKADCGRDVRIEAITDDKGVATFNDVPIGTFVISEDGSTVPTGYLVADNQTVKVEYAKTSNVTFVNEEKPNTPPDTPPQTGYNEFNPMVVALLAGIALIGIFSIYVKIAKKKEEK